MYRTKSIKKQINDKSIVDMFNQMIGATNSNPSIVIPKYVSIKKKINSLSQILNVLVRDILVKFFPEPSEECSSIINYSNTLNEVKFLEIPDEKTKTEKEELDICDDYKRLKEHNAIKNIILLYKSLIPYSNSLTITDETYISRIPGLSYEPFPFSNLNLKIMWIHNNITTHVKKGVLTVMKIILETVKCIYDTIISPDVDVKDFSSVIISSIAQVKKLIPRCEKAFAKIEESVGILEGNFNSYYKDFIQSKNPSTMIESFVIDVAKDSNSDTQTTMQFRTIINHYRKSTQGKIKDPKVKKIFDMLNANFNMMNDE